MSRHLLPVHTYASNNQRPLFEEVQYFNQVNMVHLYVLPIRKCLLTNASDKLVLKYMAGRGNLVTLLYKKFISQLSARQKCNKIVYITTHMPCFIEDRLSKLHKFIASSIRFG